MSGFKFGDFEKERLNLFLLDFNEFGAVICGKRLALTGELMENVEFVEFLKKVGITMKIKNNVYCG